MQQRTTYAGSTLRELGSLDVAAGRHHRRATSSALADRRPPAPSACRPRRQTTSPRPRRARPDGRRGDPPDAARRRRASRRSGPMPPTIDQLRGMIERDELITYVVPGRRGHLRPRERCRDGRAPRRRDTRRRPPPSGAWWARARRPCRPCTPTSTRVTRSLSCWGACPPRRCARCRGWRASSTSLLPSRAAGFAALAARRGRARRRRPRGTPQHRSLAAVGARTARARHARRRRPPHAVVRVPRARTGALPAWVPAAWRRSGAAGRPRGCARLGCSAEARPTTTPPSTRSSPRAPTSPSTSEPERVRRHGDGVRRGCDAGARRGGRCAGNQPHGIPAGGGGRRCERREIALPPARGT